MEIKEVRRKINFIQNIWELTGTLETLSAVKMRKAQKIARQSRFFAQKVAQLLRRLGPVIAEDKSIFFREPRETQRILVVVLSSDRGFCGSFNQNIFRFAQAQIKKIQRKEGVISVFPIGKKGTAFFQKTEYPITFHFFGIGDFGELEEIKPISDFVTRSFKENQFQKVHLIWTDFVSTFVQRPKIIQLLPVPRETLEKFFQEEVSKQEHHFLVEPSLEMLAQEIVPQLIEYLLYQYILEHNSAEHSARMLAMRNASENAQKKYEQLVLEYNKARQEQITSEVGEVSSTKEVLE